MNSRIVGIGSYLPDNVVDNLHLSKTLDTSDDWIVSHTGISQRHIANDKETTSYMGYKASEQALDMANMNSDDIDAIIVATSTSENIFPSCAIGIKKLLFKDQKTQVICFDVQAACAGFVLAVIEANNLIYSSEFGNEIRNVLVVGSEIMSRLVNWKDRSTCVLFGDGSGAIVLSKVNKNDLNNSSILGYNFYSDSSCSDILKTELDYKSRQIEYFTMNGPLVFRNAIKNISDSIKQLIKNKLEPKYKINRDHIDFIIPHQANYRISQGISIETGFSMEKIISTVDIHANTSAASIPLAMKAAWENGIIKKENKIIITGIGAGLCWGSVAIVL
jgi:3-oxoacyl-[acyl-carrier-protein] synthase-3